MLVAHNAELRPRLHQHGARALPEARRLAEHRFVDTLLLARRRHPNGPNSLDALCARYGIDNSARTKHGALLDAEILAEVYLELLGGRQATFALGSVSRTAAGRAATFEVGVRPQPLAPRLTIEDELAHRAFVSGLGAEPLWNRYLAAERSRA